MPPPEPVADNGASRAGRARLVTPPEQASNSGTPRSGKPAGPSQVPGDHDGRPRIAGRILSVGAAAMCCWSVHRFVSVIFALHRAAWVRGPEQVVPS